MVDTTVGGLLDHDGVIHPVVSVSILTWFIRYLHFYQYYLVDTTVGGLLDHDGVIHPVVSVSTLTWVCAPIPNLKCYGFSGKIPKHLPLARGFQSLVSLIYEHTDFLPSLSVVVMMCLKNN